MKTNALLYPVHGVYSEYMFVPLLLYYICAVCVMGAIALCVACLCALLHMETGELDQLDKLI